VGYILHIILGTYLVLFSCLGWIAAALLFALMPFGASYWAYILPAMIGATVGVDATFNVANIFITTNLSAARQGLAGAPITTLPYLGNDNSPLPLLTSSMRRCLDDASLAASLAPPLLLELMRSRPR